MADKACVCVCVCEMQVSFTLVSAVPGVKRAPLQARPGGVSTATTITSVPAATWKASTS